MVVGRGDTGLTGNIYCGLHEFNEMAYLLHVLTSTDLFIDIGANLGSYTILACACRHARSMCFEPVPATFERLRQNVAINRLEHRVQLFNLGVGEKEGMLTFTTSLDTMNHVVAKGESSADSTIVRVVPLDHFVTDVDPSVVKIDVEGFEWAVLKGAGGILRRKSLHSVIMEVNGQSDRYGFAEDDVLSLMADHGFTMHKYDAFARKLIPLNRESGRRQNSIFVRDPVNIEKRLRESPKVKIYGCEF